MTSTIPQYDMLRRRRHELAMKQARYGISSDPHIEIEAQDLDTVISLMDRIDIHRRNLAQLTAQRDRFGAHAPTHIINQIISERASVQQLRAQCGRYAQSIPPHPLDDDDAPNIPTPTPSKPVTTKQQIRQKLDTIESLVLEIRNLLIDG